MRLQPLTVLAVVVSLALAIFARAQLPARGSWRTNLAKKSIDLSELRAGGPPKDGIPSIRQPRFESIEQARTWLADEEPVMVFAQGDEARAYPQQILIWHELVNDEVDGTPILVSWCPLCNSGLVFDRTVDGQVLTFGVSGMLRMSDMVMYDEQTESLWQQLTGEAIAGDLSGKKLKILDSRVISFRQFRETFSEGKVLSRQTGYDRPYGRTPYVGYEFGRPLNPEAAAARKRGLRPLERLVAFELKGKLIAYPFQFLKGAKVVEGKVKGQRYVVFFDEHMVSPLDRQQIREGQRVGQVGVFSPLVNGKQLKFKWTNGVIQDSETRSTWNVLGYCVAGPMKGTRLEPIIHYVAFAFAWLSFRPDTEVLGVSQNVEPWSSPTPIPGQQPGSSPFPR